MSTVAIIGRPNVGKSTLFNRLTGQRKAIVDDISGVTRDRLYGVVNWLGKEFTLIDTGGFVVQSDDVFEKAVREQVKIALEESDLCLFMLDVTTGITDLDQQIAEILRKSTKKIIVVVNKVDNPQRLLEGTEFYKMGFDSFHFIASNSGSGTGELLDEVVEKLELQDEERTESMLPKLAIIGQPNVGKSSFVNALLGEEKNIVTDIPGTTRDAIHTLYNYYKKEFILIDTAGLRKKAKVHENLEFYSVIRAIKAIDEADVCVLLIDAKEGISSQDLNILRVVKRKRKGLVILVNKWDLIEKDHTSSLQFEKKIKARTAPFTDIPVLFISATNKQRIYQAIEVALDVYDRRKTKILTSVLNDLMLKIIQQKPPPAIKGKYIRIKYVTQLRSSHPVFAFFCNHPKLVREPYRNFLENKLRENFNFTGVPISIYIRKK